MAVVQPLATVKYRRDNGTPHTSFFERGNLMSAMCWVVQDKHEYRDGAVYPCDSQRRRTGPDIAFDRVTLEVL